MDELGGPKTYNHYPIGWAHAMDTPFQWTKQIASHFGGTRNGLVISWPKRIKARASMRPQFSPRHRHRADDPRGRRASQHPRSVYGVQQKPIEGVSMVYTFDDAKAPSQHTTQYFEMFANRGDLQRRLGRRHHADRPALGGSGQTRRPNRRLQVGALQRRRRLLAGERPRGTNPEKLRELQRLFYIEAAKYNVLPLDNTKVERLDVQNRPSNIRGLKRVHLLRRHGPHS